MCKHIFSNFKLYVNLHKHIREGNQPKKLGIRGIHVVPAKAKHDRKTDDSQRDPYVALCFAGVKES